MLYRDFMQKFRPLYSPDDGSGAAGGGGDGAAAAGAAGAAPAPAPVPQDTGVAAAAPAVIEAAAAAAAAPELKSEPTLLEAASGKPKPDAPAADAADGKKEEPAPADAAKTETDKAAEVAGEKKPKTEAELKADADAAKATDPENKDATADAPPAPIKYEAFKIPETVKLDDKKLQEFADIVGAKQLPQEDAQKLVDLYLAEIPRLASEMRAEQRKTWDTLNDTWKTELRNDPELGGNRLETTLSMAKAVVEEYLPANEVGEYLAHLKNNGMGNFKLHVKLLRNIGKALNVFEDGIVPANPQAPKAQKGPGNRGWYKDMPGGPSAS